MAAIVAKQYLAQADWFRDLLKAVDKDKPDKADVSALRKLLEDTPDLWRYAGDTMHHAAINLARNGQDSKAVEMSIRQGWDSLQVDLGADDAPPLEKLLIQQTVLAWMRLSFVEYQYTDVTYGTGSTYERLEHWERRLNAAHRRFLRATETLARVRKLTVQAVQINIAEQQVNQLKTG